MTLPMLPQDKANHALYGAAAFIVGAVAGARGGLPPHYIGLVLAAAVGVLKECADAVSNWRATGDPLVGPNDVDFLDAVATTCGGLLCFLACTAAA